MTSQTYGLLNNENIIQLFNKISSLPLLENININFEEIFKKGALFVINLFTSAVFYILPLIISLIVLLFRIYYMLVGWGELSFELKNYLPFSDKHKISKDIDKATRGIIYGSFLIAIIEFAIFGVGFYLSGVYSYLLLLAIIFFFAFIP